MAQPRPERVLQALDEDTPFLPDAVFSEDVVLVTGGTSGMGLGMAKAFARGGARLVLVGRDADRAARAVAEIESLGEVAVWVGADVRSPQAIRDVFDRAEEAFGPVTILANNAGANFPVLAEDISTNAWNAVTRIAIDGTFHASSEFAHRLIANRLRGAIVNNSAQYIWTGFPGDAHSAAAKTAVAHMTRSLAREWKDKGIRVNCVAAGFFPHEASGGPEGTHLARLEKMGRMIPAGRCGSMQEFGWAAAFLCSPFAQSITGQVLMLDGGESLRRSLMSPDFVPPNQRENPWDFVK